MVISILLVSQAIAQPIREVVLPEPPYQIIERGFAVPVKILINGSMGIENTTLNYEHHLENPSNYSINLVFMYYFGKKPRSLEVLVDGEKGKLETVSEDKYRAEYRLVIPLRKNGSLDVSSKMSYTTMPGLYMLGLWGNRYSFNSPISVNIEHPDLRVSKYLYGSTKGKIQLPYNVKDVNTHNCRYYEDEGFIKIDLTERTYPSFSFDFKTRRTPVKAGLFYVLMLALIFGFAIRERMKG